MPTISLGVVAALASPTAPRPARLPQVWYLDLFAGPNDYEAADNGGVAGHKEINRTTLTMEAVGAGLKRLVVQSQLELIRLRNQSPAFRGEMEVHDSAEHELHITWRHPEATLTLMADLRTHAFSVYTRDGDAQCNLMSFGVRSNGSALHA